MKLKALRTTKTPLLNTGRTKNLILHRPKKSSKWSIFRGGVQVQFLLNAILTLSFDKKWWIPYTELR